VRSHAHENGLTVLETYKDVGVSGATLNRPQLQTHARVQRATIALSV
jgi:hypothetical protein